MSEPFYSEIDTSTFQGLNHIISNIQKRFMAVTHLMSKKEDKEQQPDPPPAEEEPKGFFSMFGEMAVATMQWEIFKNNLLDLAKCSAEMAPLQYKRRERFHEFLQDLESWDNYRLIAEIRKYQRDLIDCPEEKEKGDFNKLMLTVPLAEQRHFLQDTIYQL